MAASPQRRDWLVHAVGDHPEIRVAGTAATFALLRSLMSDDVADLSLIELPQPASTASRDWLTELSDRIPIVLLSPEPDLSIFTRMRNAGTGAFLSSNASAEQIVLAIKSVAAGLTVFDSNLIPQSSEDERWAEELTPRENEVLRLIADGLSNRDIAARLNLSEHTIKFHIRSILGKLGAASRTEAVTRGLRSGLIEL